MPTPEHFQCENPAADAAPRLGRNLLFGYLILLWLQLAAVGFLTARTPRDWGLPEWTINYRGGFIRRGLMGEILLPLSHVTHIPILFLAAFVGLVAYTVLYICTAKLLIRSRWRWWIFALALGPGSFAFPVISRTSFRKDILFMAGLALLIVWLRKYRDDRKYDTALLAVLTLVLPALVLCQEPLFVYLPYVVAAVLLYTQSIRRTTLTLLLPLLLSSMALFAVAKHSGTPQQIAAVCSSVGMATNCPGGILINGKPPDDVLLWIRKYGYWQHYPWEILLSLVPIVAAVIALRRSLPRGIAVIALFSGVSMLASIMVFRFGTDWGRWINLHVTSLALLLIALDGERQHTAVVPAIARRPRLKLALASALILVYATCWSVPGNRDRPLYGYLSLGEKLLHWHGSFTD